MIEWNTVKYIDCMDKDSGLPSLPDKSIDLCLTDPPWNINYKGKTKRYKEPEKYGWELYKDDYDDEWNLTWFNELKRICNGIIIATSRSKLTWWYKNTEPRDLLIIYFKNGTGASKISEWNCWSPYIFFGDYFRKHKLFHNVIKTYIPNGFLRRKKFIHPNAKESWIWKKILKEIKPISVIDPFLGSGTCAKASIQLGIPWLGYEINEVYKSDIEDRLKDCVKEITLEGWLK